MGLEIHEIQFDEFGGKTLGILLDGKRRLCRNTWERFSCLYGGITALLERRSLAGWVVEVLLGHCTHFGMVNRDVLCIFHASYAFCTANYSNPAVLWKSVREEFRCFRGCMIYCFADWQLRWTNMVYSVDSSLHGFGIVKSIWEEDDVKAVGRVPERMRYKLDGEQARWCALSAAGFKLD